MTRRTTDKNGRTIKADDCEGFSLTMDGSNPRCKGDAVRCEKTAESFGRTFVTHATLCEKHAARLGYVYPAEVQL